jgi:hypothetical protein
MPTTLREQLKDAEFRPYVPGSSLKGAIRTVLLAEWLGQQPAGGYQSLLPRWVPDRKDPKKQVPSEKRPAFAAMRLIRSMFGNTPNQDILRALQVSDVRFQIGDLRLTDIRWFNIIQVKGQEKAAWRDMPSKKNLDKWNDANGLYAETITPASAASFTLGWDRFLLSDLTKWGAPAHGNDLLPADFPELCEILNTHARRTLENELAFFSKYQVNAPKQQAQQLLNRLQQDSEGAYLRLAWGSGWRGMTGDWLDFPSLSAMRELYRLGKGLKDAKGKWQPVGTFPKTRRLAVQGTPCLPLGWVRLSPWNEAEVRKSTARIAQRHPWVEETLTRIQRENRCRVDEALRGIRLAEAWQSLSDSELKAAALADIEARWREKGWWENPAGKAAKKALAIYRGDNG